MCGRRNSMVSEERLRGGMGNTYTKQRIFIPLLFCQGQEKEIRKLPYRYLVFGHFSSHAVRFRVCFINEEPNGVDSAPCGSPRSRV